MAAAWYYTNGGRRHGPVPAEQLDRMAADGRLSIDDLVWSEALPAWVPAGRILGRWRASRPADAGGAAGPQAGALAATNRHAVDPSTAGGEPAACILAEWDPAGETWHDLPHRYASPAEAEAAATRRGVYRVAVVGPSGRRMELDPFALVEPRTPTAPGAASAAAPACRAARLGGTVDPNPATRPCPVPAPRSP